MIIMYILCIYGGDDMKVKFREVGNSMTITIPRDIVSQLGISKGNDAEVRLSNDGFMVTPVSNKKKVTVKSLFAGYTGDYKPSEISWGEQRGKEIW